LSTENPAIVSKEKTKAGESTDLKATDPEKITPTEIVTLPLSEQETLERFNRIQHLKRSLLDPKTDMILIAGKPYIKKSGWRKLQFAFNLTDEITREEKEEKDGKTIWRMWVRVRAPNGREVIGVASASSDEKKFSHPDHDPYALCHTRSKNRAISDILGLGEVSAEEMLSEVSAGLEEPERAESTEAPTVEPANDTKSQQPITTPNHAIPTEGTKLTAETPVPATRSPEPGKRSWHVPLTTNQLSPFHIEKGIRQVFLAKGLQSFGVINQDTVNNELAIVPEKPLDPEAGPIHWLVEGTPYRKGVVKPICEKHGLQYELVLEGKLLKAIVIFGGSLDQEHVKEIAGSATWAFQRAFEEAK
jgi:hypothetical protein